MTCFVYTLYSKFYFFQLLLRHPRTPQIVATQKGGVADVTQGIDLQNGAVMPSNHLLIVPLDDGRGAQMLSDGIIMIKGNYTVK